MGGCGDTGAPGAAGEVLRPCSRRGKQRRLELPTTNHHPRPGPRPHRTERGRAGRNAETRSPPERAVSPLRGASREAASRLFSTRWSGYFTSEQNLMILNSSNGLTRVIYSHQQLIPHGEGAESQPRSASGGRGSTVKPQHASRTFSVVYRMQSRVGRRGTTVTVEPK